MSEPTPPPSPRSEIRDAIHDYCCERARGEDRQVWVRDHQEAWADCQRAADVVLGVLRAHIEALTIYPLRAEAPGEFMTRQALDRAAVLVLLGGDGA